VKIGLISDTHGMLREEVLKNFKRCDLVIHAGDIGSMDVIEKLKKISKVEFIKGNCDRISEFENIEEEKLIEFDNTKIYVVHDIKTVKKNLKELGVNIVIYGHSHKNDNYIKDEILYINPGSAGPKRFKLPTTIALINIGKNEIKNFKLDLIEI